MNVSFLFWNLRGADRPALLDSITRLAGSGIQVFLFAEGPADPANLVTALNSGSAAQYYRVASRSRRVLFFSCLGGASWTDRFYDELSDRLSAQELQVGSNPGILIVGAHLDPANYLSLEDRAEWAREIASDIRRLESDVGHERTVLAGDLNMDPFELAMSVQSLKARKGFLPFYNPMWSCFGDRPLGRFKLAKANKRPPGTYFFDNTKARANRFWKMYDQILLRPDLMESLVHLEIVDTDGKESLVTPEGRPRADSLTDHLPVLFELSL
jgi:hypothetical protein